MFRSSSMRRPPLRRAVVAGALVVAVAAPSALAAVPRSGAWIGKVVKGQAVKGKAGEPAFTVKGDRLTKFVIGGVGAYCFTGYQVVTVAVPWAKIHNGRFSRTIHPIAHANVKLTGLFLSATRMQGTVTGSGYACDYTIGFIAHRR